MLIFVPGARVHGKRSLQGYALLAELTRRVGSFVDRLSDLAPTRWPCHLTDVKAAIAWARANVDRSGDRDFSRSPVAQAGGHLMPWRAF